MKGVLMCCWGSSFSVTFDVGSFIGGLSREFFAICRTISKIVESPNRKSPETLKLTDFDGALKILSHNPQASSHSCTTTKKPQKKVRWPNWRNCVVVWYHNVKRCNYMHRVKEQVWERVNMHIANIHIRQSSKSQQNFVWYTRWIALMLWKQLIEENTILSFHVSTFISITSYPFTI